MSLKSAFAISEPVLMEDLLEYQVLRKELIVGRVDKVAIQHAAEHLGTIHNATHVSNLNKDQFDSLLIQYQSVTLHTYISVDTWIGG